MTPRSWLYVPGHRADRVAKALAAGADAVVVDLEDAVPPDQKQAARDTALRLAAEGGHDRPLWVRVNDPAGPWGEADVDALAGLSLTGLRLPRSEDPAVVREVGDRAGLPMQLLVESAAGLARAADLATAHPLVAGLGLGEADLSADLRVTGDEGLAWARGWVVVAARAAGLPSPVQSVYTDVADLAGLRAEHRARPGDRFRRPVGGASAPDPRGARRLHAGPGRGRRRPGGAGRLGRCPGTRRGRGARRRRPVRRPRGGAPRPTRPRLDRNALWRNALSTEPQARPASDALLAAVAAGVRLVELGHPHFTGMPCSPNHPGFRMSLIRRHGDMVRPDGGSAANEMIVTGGHVGTHVDALSHVSHDGKLHGGVDAAAAQTGGRFTALGAEHTPSLLNRGVLLDVAAVHGVDALPAGYGVTADDLTAAAKRAGVEVGRGDVALVRTGWARHFDDAPTYLGQAAGVPGAATDAAAMVRRRAESSPRARTPRRTNRSGPAPGTVCCRCTGCCWSTPASTSSNTSTWSTRPPKG